ncbi:hypothetical protein LCGC14_3020660, partial [marine sediment metagenome]
MTPKVILHRRPDNQLWEFWAFDEQGIKYEEEPIIEQASGAIDAEIRRIVEPLGEALGAIKAIIEKEPPDSWEPHNSYGDYNALDG